MSRHGLIARHIALTVAAVALSFGCSSDATSDSTTKPSPTSSATPGPATSPDTAPGTAPANTTGFPSSMVVLGHSGATGWNSDPDQPFVDAHDNSWATGENRVVNSIYERVLAENPAIEGHVWNVARSGSDVSDLARQLRTAFAQLPMPELFIIQAVDNDIRCDGTDEENYEPYGTALTVVLQSINETAPDATIYIVGMWATAQNYTDVTQQIPSAVAENHGGGPCDVFTDGAEQIPTAVAYFQEVTDAYGEQVRAACAAVANCTYGGDAVRNMVIEADDLTSDSNHLSITGQALMAATVWADLYG